MEKNKDKKSTRIYGANKTEAWSDAESVDCDTNVSNPPEIAVENAKDWVDENEL